MADDDIMMANQSSTGSPPVFQLPPNWIRIPTTQKKKKEDPKAADFYYFNTRTSQSVWTLPPSVSDDSATSSAYNHPKIDAAKSDKGTMFEFMHRRQAPSQPFEDAIVNGCDGEHTSERVVKAAAKEEEELTELQKIQRQVFTAKRPVALKMYGKDGLVERCKELGIYENGIKKEALEGKLATYWQRKCGSIENYFSSDIFKQELQDIAAERKECSNEKRKRDFAKAAEESGVVKKSKVEIGDKKKSLSPVVRF
jgi:hypothetical protein